jgi:hypothetical protein
VDVDAGTIAVDEQPVDVAATTFDLVTKCEQRRAP